MVEEETFTLPLEYDDSLLRPAYRLGNVKGSVPDLRRHCQYLGALTITFLTPKKRFYVPETFERLVSIPRIGYASFDGVGNPQCSSFGWLRDFRELEEVHVHFRKADRSFTYTLAARLVAAIRGSVAGLMVFMPADLTTCEIPAFIPEYHPNRSLRHLRLEGAFDASALSVMLNSFECLAVLVLGRGVSIDEDHWHALFNNTWPKLEELTVHAISIVHRDKTQRSRAASNLRSLELCDVSLATLTENPPDLSNLDSLRLGPTEDECTKTDLSWVPDLHLLTSLRLDWLPTDEQCGQLCTLAPSVDLTVGLAQGQKTTSRFDSMFPKARVVRY